MTHVIITYDEYEPILNLSFKLFKVDYFDR